MTSYKNSFTPRAETHGWGFIIGSLIAVTTFFVLVLAGLGFLTTLIWNVLVPDLLSGPYLDFTQGFAIVLGLWIVTGAFRFAGSAFRKVG